MPKSSPSLRTSSASPQLSPAKARDLVRTAALPEVLEAALDRLREANEPGLRELLLERYQTLAGNPVRLDGGAKLRTVLLQALRPLALASDVEIFEGAVLTVEIGYGKDVAQNLRAAALYGLSALDEPRAAWYATRLLNDRRHVSEVTGEPALAAARLLVTIGRPEPVYREALQGGGHPELRAECIRQLEAIPRPLLLELADDTLAGSDEPAMLGLIDLALTHAELAALVPRLRSFLAATERLDVYGYLVTAAAASRRDEAIAMLREERKSTTDRQKFGLLEGALELL